MIQSLEEFKTYQRAMELGEKVHEEVSGWNFFEKDTVGKQLVRAIDSVAANLSEGLGRYHYKEAKNFTFYARGSLFETKTWLTKARNRKLVGDESYKNFIAELDVVGKMLNTYLNSIGGGANGAKEPESDYFVHP